MPGLLEWGRLRRSVAPKEDHEGDLGTLGTPRVLGGSCARQGGVL
jgi:hypothetical protein